MIASGYQILVKYKAEQRPLLQGIWDNVFLSHDPRPKTLTEISGESGTGKTFMLYHIMARAVLPKEYGGKACKVIFIDANHKRNIVDLKRCLLDVILNKTADLDKKIEHDNILKQCLDSIIYLSCYSTEQFSITMDIIEDLLWDHDNISLLAMDGLDAFYWEDCYNRLIRMSMHYKRLCKRLKPICQEHNTCFIYTVQANYLQTKKVNNLPNPMVDYKLILHMDRKGERYVNNRHFRIVTSSSGGIGLEFS